MPGGLIVWRHLQTYTPAMTEISHVNKSYVTDYITLPLIEESGDAAGDIYLQ